MAMNNELVPANWCDGLSVKSIYFVYGLTILITGGQVTAMLVTATTSTMLWHLLIANVHGLAALGVALLCSLAHGHNAEQQLCKIRGVL